MNLFKSKPDVPKKSAPAPVAEKPPEAPKRTEAPAVPCAFHTWHQHPTDQAQHLCRHCGVERWPAGGGETPATSHL